MTTAINYDTVVQAASDVRTTATQLDTELGTLMARVKAVAENWDGEAKAAYTESQLRLTRNMSGMNDDLMRLSALLSESVIGYQDTDRGNAARFRMQM